MSTESTPKRPPPTDILDFVCHLQDYRRSFRPAMRFMPPLYHNKNPDTPFIPEDSDVFHYIISLIPALLPCLVGASPSILFDEASKIFKECTNRYGACVEYDRGARKWFGVNFDAPGPLPADPDRTPPLKKRRLGFWKARQQTSRDREPIYIALSKMEPQGRYRTLHFITRLVKAHLPEKAMSKKELDATTSAIFESVKTRKPREIEFDPTTKQWRGSGMHISLDEGKRLYREGKKMEAAADRPSGESKIKPKKAPMKPAAKSPPAGKKKSQKKKPKPKSPPMPNTTKPKLTMDLLISCIPKDGIALCDLPNVVSRVSSTGPNLVLSIFRDAERQKRVQLQGRLWFRAKTGRA